MRITVNTASAGHPGTRSGANRTEHLPDARISLAPVRPIKGAVTDHSDAYPAAAGERGQARADIDTLTDAIGRVS